MADPDRHERLWLWVGGALLVLAAAAAGIAKGTAKSGVDWDGPELLVAYLLVASAFACFVAAVRGVPFPLVVGSHATNEAVATPGHERVLRDLLQDALNAIDGEQSRSLADPLLREMFEAHFADLDGCLRAWDKATVRMRAAPMKLRMRFDSELADRKLNQEPYIEQNIAAGFTEITGQRSVRGELEKPLPPCVGTPDSMWLGFSSTRSELGIVDFNERALGIRATCLSLPAMESDDAYRARIKEVLAPIYELLEEAQAWEQAGDVRSAIDAFQALPRQELRQAVRRTLISRDSRSPEGVPDVDYASPEFGTEELLRLCEEHQIS